MYIQIIYIRDFFSKFNLFPPKQGIKGKAARREDPAQATVPVILHFLRNIMGQIYQTSLMVGQWEPRLERLTTHHLR
ncbi:hypothetical protein GDO78_006638 [Eleutherodactylus coqui]|uniref:Uncharacterized protein n=1 Tax=Eleutherodactylus coqui TaxID=57060 RepID=A0A8J6FF35_ELECQ|nr:hypothetical protein GDO78_006638 [Eleutherodactylus coqui]